MSFVLLSGFVSLFSTPAPTVPKFHVYVSNQPEPVEILMTFTHRDAQGVWQGTFTATGGLNATGTATMLGHPLSAVALHCVNTLYTPNGTITILSYCNFATNPSKGQWHIESGTGDYSDLNGNGSLMMPMSPAGPVEDMSGTVR